MQDARAAGGDAVSDVEPPRRARRGRELFAERFEPGPGRESAPPSASTQPEAEDAVRRTRTAPSPWKEKPPTEREGEEDED